MSDERFIALAALVAGIVLAWGFRYLPGDRWQFLACLPLTREAPDRWRGLNLTWYGLLSANGQAAAAAWFMLLLTAMGVPWTTVAVVLAVLVALCLSGSRRLAQLVENKAHTFTVGGASFLGMALAPGMFWLVNRLLDGAGERTVPLMGWCAALTTAHALGEGLGRLACISFGCCYGKPLDQCPPRLARLFARAHFVFHGSTKKIAYAGGLEGRPVLPVQAVTAVIHLVAALTATYLFLRGALAASLLVGGLTTQTWRVLSEFLRDDYRGEGSFSAYQWMALAAALWLALLAWILPEGAGSRPSLSLGLRTLWAPGPLVALQGLWLAAFIYYGRSRVTSSQVSFSVLRDLV